MSTPTIALHQVSPNLRIWQVMYWGQGRFDDWSEDYHFPPDIILDGESVCGVAGCGAFLFRNKLNAEHKKMADVLWAFVKNHNKSD